jgi:hypothetical protein
MGGLRCRSHYESVQLIQIVRCACSSLSAAVSGLAQNTNSGDIRGIVTDATGAVMPGTTVTLLNTDTGVVRQLNTNAAGLYDAVSILPGQYRITFEKQGFQKVVRDGIVLSVGAISVDAQLSVGSAQQQVVVTEQTPLLVTESPEQSSNIAFNTLQELPNVTPDWQNIVKMIPGAVGAPATGQGSGGVQNPGVAVSINGTLPFYSSYLADGASIRLPHSANIGDDQIFEPFRKFRSSRPPSAHNTAVAGTFSMSSANPALISGMERLMSTCRTTI